MGKSSKKSNTEVAPAAASSPVSKSTKKGKRDSEVALEKPLIAKKQKKETVEVQIKQKDDKKSKKAPPPKKPETSSSEDTSSDSEKEVKVAPKIVVQPVKQLTKQKDDKKSKKAPPPKKKHETSSSEDMSSDSEEEVDVAPKKVVEPVKLPAKVSSSSEESSSDEEMKPLSGDSSAKVPVTGVKNGTALASKKKDDSSDEDSDSSESDSDEDEGNLKKTIVVSKVVSSQKKGVQDSSSGTSESESDDEEVTAKQASLVQKPPIKVTAGASNKKDESSESLEGDLGDKKPKNKPKVEESSEDSSDESSSDGEEEPQKKKLKVPEATGLNVSKPNVKAAKKESSSDEDEDDSSDESSDDEPPKVQKNKSTKPSTKSSSRSEESADDSSEESEDEQPKKTLAKKVIIDLKDAANGTLNQSAKKFHKEEKTPAGNQSASSGVKALFVGNLSFNVTEDELVEFFKEAGEVIDIRLSKFDDGSFKGFGHVEFSTVEEAQRALKLNGEELLGRAVKLDFARERGSAYTPSSGKDNRSFQKDGKGQSQTIFVRGFDKSLEMDQIQSSLEEHFGACGDITRISLPKDYETGVSKGIGYLDFGDKNAFSNALELNGSDLGGYTLTVEEAKPKIDNRDGGWSGGRGSGRDGGWSGGRGSGRGGRDGGWGGGRGGARGRGGGRGGRGRGGRDGAHKQSAGTPSQGRKTTFGDD